MKALSDDENPEPSLRDVMSMLGNISRRLSVNEQKVDRLTSHRDSRAWLTNLSPVPAERGAERRGQPTTTILDGRDALHG